MMITNDQTEIHSPPTLGKDTRSTDPLKTTRKINMINEEELTGELRGDFTELRILQQNGEFVDINSLLATGASGVNDIVNGGD